MSEDVPTGREWRGADRVKAGTRMRLSNPSRWALRSLLLVLVGCGGGSPVELVSTPSSFDVRVSAGTPVIGATVTVYAVSDATGLVNTAVGAGGVLGSAGPTDATGRVTVTVQAYSGPVQVVAGGPSLAYPDPTTPPDDAGTRPLIQFPSSFVLTSYVARFTGGEAMTVPVTFLTTLADRASLAYALGRHAAHPRRVALSEALAARDPLFVAHITKAAAAWDVTTLRTTVPASLTGGPQTLVDATFAALFDVGLNQLARDTAARAGYGTESGGLTGPTLLQLLSSDLDADGCLDGKGSGGGAIVTAGSTPVTLDAQFLRKRLAVSLDAWIRNGAVNKSGISDADLVSAQVFKTITEDQSDLFGVAPIEPFDPLDREPPQLAFAAAPPTYVAQSYVDLVVRAADATGVKVVYARAGSDQHSGILVEGAWHVRVPLATAGHNTITVWAEDLAEPFPNSGFDGEAPHELVLDVVHDPDAPTATYDTAFASYADERTMTVATGPDGFARVPAEYTLGPRTTVPNGGPIYKAATRIAAGAPLDAAELEAANAGNIPVLRFVVPFNDKTDSPLTSARFVATVTCPECPDMAPATGALLASSTPAAMGVHFVLPLAAETIPQLATVTGPATLDVTLELADAAGNAASVGGFLFGFHVIGPPLAVAEDAAYAGYGDRRSTYPYVVAGTSLGVDSYATLWDTTSPNFYGGAVRLVRYVISNPSPKPVAIGVEFAQSAAGSWQMVETWPRDNRMQPPTAPKLNDPNSATAVSIDGFTFWQPLYWAQPYGQSGGFVGFTKTQSGQFPCTGGHSAGWAAHRIGDRATKYVCFPGSPFAAVPAAVFSSSDVVPAVFSGVQQGGGEVLPSDRDASGTMFVVPGAAGGVPGALAVYLTRPVAAPRTRPLQTSVLAEPNRYETYDYEIFVWAGSYRFTYYSSVFNYEVFHTMKSGQYLQSASELLNGALTITTQGLSERVLVGEPATAYAASFSARTLSTH
jgi:hypothetical protein